MNTELRIEPLRTDRLLLRPYVMEDAEQLTSLLQDPEIHRWTNSIPFPYSMDDARSFISRRAEADETGSSFVWAVTHNDSGQLIGAMGLHEVDSTAGRGELGYWLGESFRGQGFATEAARRVISWSFERLELYRVQATYLPGNTASAGVMRNIGMREEGLLRGYAYKNGEHHDLHINAILSEDPTWISSEDQLAGLR